MNRHKSVENTLLMFGAILVLPMFGAPHVRRQQHRVNKAEWVWRSWPFIYLAPRTRRFRIRGPGLR